MTAVVGVTGHADPENEAPWAMPLAFLVDKADPASVTAICEAAAKATLSLLADPRSLEGEWKDSVERWQDGRIRKVVRRGKPALFARAEAALPGVTVHHAGATARAFVPRSTEALPADLNRLQVSGSEPPALGAPAQGALLRIFVNPILRMSVGKKAAQVSHAAQLAWMQMTEKERCAWKLSGFSLSVIHPEQFVWIDALAHKKVSVTDAGFTEIPPGSNTCVAIW